jgi:hypothetical protein
MKATTLGPVVVGYLLHPRRWSVAFRAGWHFGAFLLAYAVALGRAADER